MQIGRQTFPDLFLLQCLTYYICIYTLRNTDNQHPIPNVALSVKCSVTLSTLQTDFPLLKRLFSCCVLLTITLKTYTINHAIWHSLERCILSLIYAYRFTGGRTIGTLLSITQFYPVLELIQFINNAQKANKNVSPKSLVVTFF